jgi:hypothetical protein
MNQLSRFRSLVRSRRAISRSMAVRTNSARFSFSRRTASMRAKVPPLKRAGICSSLIRLRPTRPTFSKTHPPVNCGYQQSLTELVDILYR